MPPKTTAAASTVATKPSPLALSLVPRSIEDLERLATIVFKAGPPPGHGNVPSVAMAIAFGLEIGLLPMQAIASVMVVNGKPSIYGDAALGMLYASPLVEKVDHGVRGDGDARQGWITTKRKGEATEHTTTFSIADANTAQLWGKKGPWTAYPDRMLAWKAVGHHMKDRWADVLRGLTIYEDAVAEIEARGDRLGKGLPAVETDQPSKITVKAERSDTEQSGAEATPSATTPSQQPATEESGVGSGPVTNAQLAKLAGELRPAFLALRNVDKTDAEAISQAWGRLLDNWKVKSARELTEAQADDLIRTITEARDATDPTVRGLFLTDQQSAA